MKQDVCRKEASIVGEVNNIYHERLIMQTRLEFHRIVGMLSGELLVEIC
ncbi:MAG: hypothetical protein J7L19_03535 [Dehalococcoidia bacterium]|nr:hypothetical protein [Dehalococcoidia bacterium]